METSLLDVSRGLNFESNINKWVDLGRRGEDPGIGGGGWVLAYRDCGKKPDLILYFFLGGEGGAVIC